MSKNHGARLLDHLCGYVDTEISKNEDRSSSVMTLRQELNSSRKEGCDPGWGE